MKSQIHEMYHRDRKKRILISASLILCILLLSVYSLTLSTYKISFVEAYDALYKFITGGSFDDHKSRLIKYLVLDCNLPRTACAILVGGTLSVCGALMQSMTHNPLTDPYTMGISSASLLGVALAISFGFCVVPGMIGDDATMINAFVFALIPSILIIVFSTFRRLSSTMMVLTGIGIMYMFTAFSTFIKINSDAEKLSDIYMWSVGTLSKITYDSVAPLFFVFMLSLVVSILWANKVNIISSGDQIAKSLGENPGLIRIAIFVMISICVAICVSYSGTIGFVGLVAPHIARLFTGNNNRVLLPASAIVGAMLLLVSDCVVRALPLGLPVGVATAIIGSPLFIYFLYRQRRTSTF